MAFVRGRRDESSASIIFDNWSDRPLPSPRSRCPNGVSFPNPKVCQVLDKIWAQRCDYSDDVTVREQDIHPPHELLVTRTLGQMSIRDTSSFSKEAEAANTILFSQMSPHLPRPIFARRFFMWQLRFFIREDLGRLLHVYPHVGGPFQSTQEADDAISRHLDELRSPYMCTDGLSLSEIGIRNTLYWPDGTRKMSSKNCPRRRNIVAMVHSLLDKYNEDRHNHWDLGYELDDVVSSGEIYESDSNSRMFYHINFTAKRLDGFHIGDDNLFFAEVICLEGENEEYELNCLCAVNRNDKGRCYGCENNGSADLKHPTDARKYKGGHSSHHRQCCGFRRPLEILGDFCAYDDEEAMLAAEESRIRRIYKSLDDEVYVAKLLDGARRAASAVSSKREDCKGKKAEKVLHRTCKAEGGSRAAPADSSTREDGQGEGSRKRYVIPAKRLQEYVRMAR